MKHAITLLSPFVVEVTCMIYDVSDGVYKTGLVMRHFDQLVHGLRDQAMAE